MPSADPHFLLLTAVSIRPNHSPRWRFELRTVDNSERIVATDVELGAGASRLELLAVVRGLEALAQPSEVTLLTASRYVRRAIRHDLSQWREQGWRWERFGRLVTIRDQDLWERIDRAAKIHQVECWPSASRAVQHTTSFGRPLPATGSMGQTNQRMGDDDAAGQIVVLRPGYFVGGHSALSRTA